MKNDKNNNKYIFSTLGLQPKINNNNSKSTWRCRIFKEIKKNPIKTIATFIAVVASIISAYFFGMQILESRKQTSYIRREFHEAYRPIGSAKSIVLMPNLFTDYKKIDPKLFAPSLIDTTILKINKPIDISKFDPSFLKAIYTESIYKEISLDGIAISGWDNNFSLTNKGKGVLLFIGALSHATNAGYTDFRDILLKGEIDVNDINFDVIKETQRLKPIFENESLPHRQHYNYVKYSPTSYLFLYTIFLYKDQQNELLYDTVHCDQFKFSELTIPAVKRPFEPTEQYHIYTEDDRKKIISIIKMKEPNHNLLNFLEK